MAIITILGAGMMGSAFCVPLADKGHIVRLVGTHLDRTIIENLKTGAYHPTLKLHLPRSIHPYFVEQLGEAARNADVLGLGVSSAGLHWAAEKIQPFVKAQMPIVMITKGMELSSDGRLSVFPDVVRDALPETLRSSVFPAAVAGPCIAGELARRVPTSVVLAGRNPDALHRLQSLLHTPYYHLFPSVDASGAEVCAALKNAYAMGVALGPGLHEKNGGTPGSVAMHNWESAVFAQAIVEMMRVVKLLGGDVLTAAGLAGAGDLDVTMNGGRTGRFGRFLGMGMGVRQAVAKMEGATLECLEILAVMRKALPFYEERGELLPTELPLIRQLMRIALDDEPVSMPFDRFFGGMA